MPAILRGTRVELNDKIAGKIESCLQFFLIRGLPGGTRGFRRLDRPELRDHPSFAY